MKLPKKMSKELMRALDRFANSNKQHIKIKNGKVKLNSDIFDAYAEGVWAGLVLSKHMSKRMKKSI